MTLAADSAYFSRRARQSHQAAEEACDKGPAGIHASLALSYERLVETAELDRNSPEPAAPQDIDAGEHWDNEGGAGAKPAFEPA